VTAEVDTHHPGTCQKGGGWKMKGSRGRIHRKGEEEEGEKDTEGVESERIRK